jgi:hypothetical protein
MHLIHHPDWSNKPWLTILAALSAGLAVVVLALTLAMWRLPTWRANLAPIATSHKILFEQATALPQEVWRTQTPVVRAPLPRYVLNATPVTVPPHHSRIAIVLDDMGVVPGLTETAINSLPREVTFSFLPYGTATASLAQLARLKGHEIMIHLPMEPQSTADPGPQALLQGDTPAIIEDKLARQLNALLPLAVGANNHMGSKFTGWAPGMKTVLSLLEEKGLFFLDSVTTSQPASRWLKSQVSLPMLERQVFLDHYIEDARIMEFLEKTVALAKKRGRAIAIGHPHPATVRALTAWLPTLAGQDISLVPITNLLQRP